MYNIRSKSQLPKLKDSCQHFIWNAVFWKTFTYANFVLFHIPSLLQFDANPGELNGSYLCYNLLPSRLPATLDCSFYTELTEVQYFES